MTEFWFADENIVFSLALIAMFALGLFQLFGVGDFGAEVGVDLDGNAELGSSADGLLGFFGLGYLPLIMFLVLFLALFSIAGFAGQQIYQSSFGTLLSPWIAVPAAGGIALVLTSLLARPLARIVPHDETTAIDRHSLVGRRAIIQTGTARKGASARAKVTDQFGQTHYVMVEPQNDGDFFREGEEVLIVLTDGQMFTALPTVSRLLSLDD